MASLKSHSNLDQDRGLIQQNNYSFGPGLKLVKKIILKTMTYTTKYNQSINPERLLAEQAMCLYVTVTMC